MPKSPAIHRTPLYRAKAAYRNMNVRCGNADGNNPAYAAVELRMTMEQWLAWAVPRYEDFIREYPEERPNVSRRNDVGHYELGNIEITTLEQNRAQMASKHHGLVEVKCPSCGEMFGRSKR